MIEENLRRIHASIAHASQMCNRDSRSIRLVAVSKMQPIELIREAYNCGHRCFGESRIQEACEKINSLPGDIEWHFIGSLQGNKIKTAVKHFRLIHSIDSFELASEVNRRAAQIQKIQDILIEVNIAQERSKHGISLANLRHEIPRFLAFPNLHVRGVMAIPPWDIDPEISRAYFRALREEAKTSWQIHGLDCDELELSMGMSSDFEIAIHEGATYIRVGTSLFGHRT